MEVWTMGMFKTIWRRLVGRRPRVVSWEEVTARVNAVITTDDLPGNEGAVLDNSAQVIARDIRDAIRASAPYRTADGSLDPVDTGETPHLSLTLQRTQCPLDTVALAARVLGEVS
jgi:hypothetical protein